MQLIGDVKMNLPVISWKMVSNLCVSKFYLGLNWKRFVVLTFIRKKEGL